MNVLIIEDESLTSKMLEVMISKLRPDWKVLATLESVKSSVEWLSNNPSPDLIFLDIRLSDGTSFAIFDEMELTCAVIFTTAFDKYAIKAFDVNSIDYLLKPVRESKLLKSIVKFETIVAQSIAPSKPDYSEIIAAIKDEEKKYRTRFLIARVNDYLKIEVTDIAYFYSEERVVYAVTFDGKEHILSLTIENLEEQLNPENYFRANRSTIVNNDAIRKFENYFGGKLSVSLQHPLTKKIAISRLKASAFKVWLDN